MFCAGTVLVISSCNTFIGVGRDFESLGTGMQNKAYGKKWNDQGSTTAESTPDTTAAAALVLLKT